MADTGIRGIQTGTELLHDGLQAADGRLKGDAIDKFVKHCHRLHQKKRAADDLISRVYITPFLIAASTLAQEGGKVKSCFPQWNDPPLSQERVVVGYFRLPGYFARLPSSSSMRRRRLYLATRSLRLGAPLLICPAFRATARSAMVVSSVSPERWERMTR